MKYSIFCVICLTIAACNLKDQRIVVTSNDVGKCDSTFFDHLDTVNSSKIYSRKIKDDMSDSVSLFSNEFLQMLNEPWFCDMKIKNGKLFYKSHEIEFPNDLELNRKYEFLSDSGETESALNVQRINYTSLSYIYLLKQSDSIKKIEGFAHIGAFFLASEIDEDPEEQNIAYGSNQYDDTNGVSLRIGIGKDSKGRLRANVDGVLLRCTPN
jgi:hypothetical protein